MYANSIRLWCMQPWSVQLSRSFSCASELQLHVYTCFITIISLQCWICVYNCAGDRYSRLINTDKRDGQSIPHVLRYSPEFCYVMWGIVKYNNVRNNMPCYGKENRGMHFGITEKPTRESIPPIVTLALCPKFSNKNINSHRKSFKYRFSIISYSVGDKWSIGYFCFLTLHNTVAT